MFPRWVSWLARIRGALSGRKSAVVALCLVCTTALLFLLYILRDREPEHLGHTASTWIGMGATNTILIPEVVEAFEKMGPEGIVFLGEQLLREPSRRDQWLLEHHQYIPATVRNLFLSPPQAARDDTILLILASLGTNAAPAVPSLLTWLESKANTFVFEIPIHTPGFKIVTNRWYPPGGDPPPTLSMPVNNQPPLLIVPQQSTITIRTQAVALANSGQLGTNLSISVKPYGRQISQRAVQVLTNVGGEDPRIAEALSYPVQFRPSDPPPTFGLNLKPAVMRALPSLISCAEYSETNRSVRAISLLRLALPESTAAHELMRQTLDSPNPVAFELAASVLRQSTNEMDRVMALTATGLRTSHGWYQREVDELRKLVQSTPAAIEYLQPRLKNAKVSHQALLLKLIGETASREQVDLEFIGSFTNRLEAQVRAQAFETVGMLTSAPAMQAQAHIIRIEANPGDSTLISQAYLNLGDLGAAARPGMPLLITGLKSEETRLVIAAAEALGKMGIHAQAALPDLRSLTSHENPRIREAAKASLQQLTNVFRSVGRN